MGSTQGIRRGERAESGLDKSLILGSKRHSPSKMLSKVRREWRSNEDACSLLSASRLLGLDITLNIADSSMALATKALINE